MIQAELGSGLLLVALVFSLFSTGIGAWSGWRGDPLMGWIARRAFYVAAVAVVLASALLVQALVTHDFVIAFVTEHTDRSTSVQLLVAAFYGGQEGSLLYWVLVLSVLGTAALASAASAPIRVRSWAGTVLAAILGFFLTVLVFVASPFDTLVVVPPDGLGLNPLLRDIGMLVHPPFLLAGFASFAIPFSFAIGALLAREAGAGWIRLTRNFALLAWGLQTVGLVLGMWWAYHVLGWGGYWGWDPVENVALLPWLASTAYIHSAQVQERRGTLRAWNFGLVILSFLLAVFGTFVVRSGVIQSVHSFAVSSIGPWFLVFLAACIMFSGLVLLIRLPELRSAPPLEALVSREGAFLLNNILFMAIAFAVLWGTLLPLVSGFGGGLQSVVGPTYYQRAAGPLFLLLMALLAVGPMVPWQRVGSRWLRTLRVQLLAGLLVTTLLLAAGIRAPVPLLTGAILGAAAATSLLEFYRGAQFARRLSGGWWSAAWRLALRNRRRYAAYLAHLGMVLIAAGIAASQFGQQERQVVLHPGQQATIGSYTLTYKGTTAANMIDSVDYTANLSLGSETLRPQHLVYGGGSAGTRVAIRSTPLEDLYVVLTNVDGDGSASFVLFVNPLVTWIWAGAALLIYGVWLGSLGARPSPVERTVRMPAPILARAAGE